MGELFPLSSVYLWFLRSYRPKCIFFLLIDWPGPGKERVLVPATAVTEWCGYCLFNVTHSLLPPA